MSLPFLVDAPGVYEMSDSHYHLDPVPAGSLSSSGARKLLPPSCPAKFKHERDHGQPHRDAFDFGHAAHMHVLGAGAAVSVIDADDWRTKKAQEAKKEAHAAGLTPLLASEWAQVLDMGNALRAHPIASALLDPDNGRPEQSLFWQDERHGVWRRARVDWLPQPRPNGRLLLTDLKTTLSADPGSIAKSCAQYGYANQAAWYMDGAAALGLAAPDDIVFLFIFVEKAPPHVVTVCEIDADGIRVGRELNDRALATYRDCVDNDFWPGHTADVELISLPYWYMRQHEGAL